MGRVVLWIIVAIVAIGIAGAVWLTTADVPAPTRHVEQVIPNDRLGR